MNRWNRTPTGALLLALAVAGCASQQPDPELTAAEARYDRVASLPGVASTAPRDMRRARDALDTARARFEDGEDEAVDHFALLALKNLEIAEERHQLAQIREQIDDADSQRQQMLLSAREGTAQRAQQDALMARAQLEERERELERTRQEMQRMAEELGEMKELNAEQQERGLVLTLSDVVFDFDAAELNPGGERVVERVAEFLDERQERKIRVEGFTDAVGSEEYNRRLSERRAQAVADALRSAGIDASRIATAGYGESFPVASNDSDSGRQLNRRVEIIIGNDANEVPGRSVASQ